MAAVRENTVERRFNLLARRHGGLSLKWVSPGRLGVPDRLLFMPGGRLYLVELKRPGGRPRASLFCFNVCSTGSAVFFRSVG